MEVQIEKSWKKVLKDEFEKPYFKELVEFVKNEYKQNTVFPPGPFIFRAFDKTPFDEVKVVIIGQDPYHTPGKANGLAFSVSENESMPPSLINIFKERKNDLGIEIPESGELEHWAGQGVLLLNATLTVRKGNAGSHQRKGWERFTDSVIEVLNNQKENIVFVLWGRYAQDKGAKIDEKKHFVVKSPHPSPFSADRGFFGSKPFSRANEYLKEHGKVAVEW